MFYLLDPEKWERQKHFEYYMQMIPCGYTVTVRLDVENLYQQVEILLREHDEFPIGEH